MKNKLFILVALCAVVVAFSACSLFGNKEVTFSESDLIGTWQENGTEAFVRFLSERADSEYKYGYEWDEADEVFPEDGDYNPEQAKSTRDLAREKGNATKVMAGSNGNSSKLTLPKFT